MLPTAVGSMFPWNAGNIALKPKESVIGHFILQFLSQLNLLTPCNKYVGYLELKRNRKTKNNDRRTNERVQDTHDIFSSSSDNMLVVFFRSNNFSTFR